MKKLTVAVAAACVAGSAFAAAPAGADPNPLHAGCVRVVEAIQSAPAGLPDASFITICSRVPDA